MAFAAVYYCLILSAVAYFSLLSTAALSSLLLATVDVLECTDVHCYLLFSLLLSTAAFSSLLLATVDALECTDVHSAIYCCPLLPDRYPPLFTDHTRRCTDWARMSARVLGKHLLYPDDASLPPPCTFSQSLSPFTCINITVGGLLDPRCIRECLRCFVLSASPSPSTARPPPLVFRNIKPRASRPKMRWVSPPCKIGFLLSPVGDRLGTGGGSG